MGSLLSNTKIVPSARGRIKKSQNLVDVGQEGGGLQALLFPIMYAVDFLLDIVTVIALSVFVVVYKKFKKNSVTSSSEYSVEVCYFDELY